MKRAHSMSKDDAVLFVHPETQMPPAGSSFNQTGEGPQVSAGALLREARQAQGLDIATLANLLKVPVQKLEALEQDQFDLLLDPVFARVLASSMCRILKLDPAQILQRLPAITAFNVTTQNRGINAPFRARDGGHGASLWSHISLRAVVLGLVLLLGALVLVFLPFVQQEVAGYRQHASPSGLKSDLAEPVSATTPVTTKIAPNGGAEVAPNAPVEPLPLPPVEAQAFVLPAVAAPAASPASESAANTSANAMIAFSAKAESWVKVTDAKGVVVLSRTLRAGESVDASGALPLLAIVGRADAMQVQVHGQAFGLTAVTKNNVARFEVK